MNVKNIQSAAKLRIVLSIVLFLTLALIGGGFYFSQKVLRSYAKETSVLNSEASASTQNLSSLRQIEKYLEDHQDDVLRAKDIVAESKQYKYQDEIIKDVSAFASASGIKVTSFEFTDSQASSSTPQGNGTQAPKTPAAPVPSGVTPVTAKVTFSQPVNYKNLLNFMNRIENNITRMQIGSVGISRQIGENGAIELSSDAFTIEVYIRK